MSIKALWQLLGIEDVKFIGRTHRGWTRMWSMIVERYGDVSCRNNGEAWQYMGSFLVRGQWLHEFRHRSLPPDGKACRIDVPAHADDFEPAVEAA